MSDDRYVFIVYWFDSAASLIRLYNFTYFVKDKSIEMFDLKNKRIFLKKCEFPGLQLKDIFIGAVLNVYSRQLKVVNYADEFTQNKFESQRGRSLVMIKPDAYMQIGKIINILEEAHFTITNFKLARLTKADAETFYAELKGTPYFNQKVDFLISDVVAAFEVVSQDCINKLKDIVGNADPQKARAEHPKSIRAQFGEDSIKNAVHSSESASSAVKEIYFFFYDKSTLTSPAYFNNCSCLVIKPHIINDGYVGQIIDCVLVSGFYVSAAYMFWLDRPSAEVWGNKLYEFLEVYKGVVPEYNQMIEEFTNGPCIALEVRQENVVSGLRELCGPHDPDMARNVRPKSLRAVYGKDKGKNGVHCTDLAYDGVLEVEYFFNILQRK